MSNKTIQPAAYCKTHRSLLMEETQFGPNDPWQIMEVLTMVALLQATSASPVAHERMGGDITRIAELGCLACFSPDAFSQLCLKVRGHKDVATFAGIIKEFGESFVFKKADPT